MSPPDPDADPADAPPKPLMGPGFWIMLVFAALCILAGAAVAYVVPRLL